MWNNWSQPKDLQSKSKLNMLLRIDDKAWEVIIETLTMDINSGMIEPEIKKELEEAVEGVEYTSEWAVIIPEDDGVSLNDFRIILEGTYDTNGIVELLRTHKENPEMVQFIADMMEH